MNSTDIAVVAGFAALVICATAVPISLAAQRADSIPMTSRTDKTFFTRRDAILTGAAVVGTIAAERFDLRISRWTQKPEVQGSSSRHHVVKSLTVVNETPFTFGAVAVYGIGRLAHSPTTADVGLHMTEALVLTSGIGQAIRGVVGRARPSSSHGDPLTHKYGKGFSDFEYRSFPSLHAATAFAASAAAVEEIRLRDPSVVKWAAPLLYGVATIPGFTRLYLNKHWASDVVAGSFLGALMGVKTVRYAHSHRRTRLDRALLGASIAPDGHGGIDVAVNVVP
ncbi:MAG: phosphatase PAP2 family protein [Gemmatimonadaceae bacterium]|nr:phosphatase PAP2 family protein [Gemmatimonadaceae bacterium]